MEKSKEHFLSYKHNMRVKDLLTFIKEHNISEDALIMVQRVEDRYYDGVDISGMTGLNGIIPEGTNAEGWSVLKKDNEHTHSAREFNKSVDNGDFDKNPMERYSEEQIDSMKSEYHPAWSCVGYEDKDMLFIDLHY